MASMLARNALALARSRASLATRSICTMQTSIHAGAVSPALLMTLNPATVPTPIVDPFVRNAIVFEITPSNHHITQTPAIAPSMVECPTTDNAIEPLQAVKRTYQPSVLRRKRKHGFRTRVVSVSGRKLLKRRFLKGRWRMSL